MRPERQWIKLHQRIQEHPWLNDRPEWFAAWVQILLAADNQGRVDLTDIQARDHFTPKAWRHFIGKLEVEEMISGRHVINLGRTKGQRNVAQIASWSAYQSFDEVARTRFEEGQSNPPSKGRSKGRSSSPSETKETGGEGRSKGHTEGQSKVRSLSSIDKKEKTPPTPPQHLDPATAGLYGEGKRSTLTTLSMTSPEDAAFLEKVARAARWKFDQKADAAEILLEQPDIGRSALRETFDSLDGLKYSFKYFRKRVAGAQEEQQAKTTVPTVPVGTVVNHPTWDRRTVIGYTRNGELRLDNSAVVSPSEVTVCRN